LGGGIWFREEERDIKAWRHGGMEEGEEIIHFLFFFYVSSSYWTRHEKEQGKGDVRRTHACG
jgi:hypothetical protein